MPLDHETVTRIARLARIRLTQEVQEKTLPGLNSILGFVEQLSSINTEGVEPMVSASATTLRLREDRVDDGHCRDAVLANAPESFAGFFVVPKVVE
ncbi:MAG TPA: Asp-tRNA(Asn)/Glu-tRNA(Gln) amidotransferase GatCAB subunit C [Rhodospirillaceae bacterium]|nr:MAG: asparaginyl/glutamyl-tRNA amidotransferase subunit C [Alphaproteobacteria bacterium GWF2_58_20]HAU29697.1 Asp-tRNA(Asn)/Glu-tRNA(Gln) amidotransferase GatCAB subunit C [Rhodospirillaceae bacterium]